MEEEFDNIMIAIGIGQGGIQQFLQPVPAAPLRGRRMDAGVGVGVEGMVQSSPGRGYVG